MSAGGSRHFRRCQQAAEILGKKLNFWRRRCDFFLICKSTGGRAGAFFVRAVSGKWQAGRRAIFPPRSRPQESTTIGR